MSQIYKWTLDLPTTTLHLPVFSKPLHVGSQGGIPRVWIQHPTEPEPKYTKWEFVVVGTGYEADLTGLTYLGTIQQSVFVLHVYYKEV